MNDPVTGRSLASAVTLAAALIASNLFATRQSVGNLETYNLPPQHLQPPFGSVSSASSIPTQGTYCECYIARIC
jgi:hypothetical protein